MKLYDPRPFTHNVRNFFNKTGKSVSKQENQSPLGSGCIT